MSAPVNDPLRDWPGLVSVFAAVNESLKEYHVGIATMPVSELMRLHREKPPAAIGHWRQDHRISYRCVAASFPAKDVEEFVAYYMKDLRESGWKVVK